MGRPSSALAFPKGARVLLPFASLVLSVVAGCERKPTADPPPIPSAAASAPDAASSVSAAVSASAAPVVLEKVEVPEVRIRADGPTTVRVVWTTPKGTAVNDDAPFRVRWNRSDGLVDAPSDVKSTGSAVKEGFRVKVKPMTGAPNATLDGEINIVVCDSATHSVCVPVRRGVELGFVVAKDATEETTVSIPLPAAK